MTTEEDLELVAAALRETDVRLAINDADVWYIERARAVLAALSSANRLVPPGGETTEGKREWRVRFPTTGRVLTLSPLLTEQECRDAAVKAIEQGLPAVVESRVVTPWSPSVPDTEEGT